MPAKEVAAKKPAAVKPAAKPAAKKLAAKPAAKAPVASVKVPANVAAAAKPAAKPRVAKAAVKKADVLVIENATQDQIKQILAAFQSGGVSRTENLGGKITKAQKEVLAKLAKQLGTTVGALQAAIVTAFLAGVK